MRIEYREEQSLENNRVQKRKEYRGEQSVEENRF